MKLPIKIQEKDGYSEFYPTKESAEQSMEVVDVRNGEYRAYDSENNELNITIVNIQHPIFFGLLKISTEAIRITEKKTPYQEK